MGRRRHKNFPPTNPFPNQRHWKKNIDNFTVEAPYGGCCVYSPEGILMFYCNEKKRDWYVHRKGIAEPYKGGIRLLFEPNGLGNHNKPNALRDVPNLCVACGQTSKLTRHHCVPYCFRKYFPLQYKRFASHDVLPMCYICHQQYEVEALRLKKQLAVQYGVEMDMVTREALVKIRAVKAARALVKHADVIPELRKAELLARIEEYWGEPPAAGEIEIISKTPMKTVPAYIWSERIVQQVDVFEFSRMWREHFLATVKPKFLPENWSLDGQQLDLDVIP